MVVMGQFRKASMSRRYWYMDGVANELALRHIPHVAPRQDELAGPVGRRGDQVHTYPKHCVYGQGRSG